MLGTIKDSLLSLFFPLSCKICSGVVENAADGVACAACWTESRIFDRSEMLCAKCGAYFGEKAAPVAVYCHQCDDHQFDKAFALGIYENALAAIVVNLKNQPVLPVRVLNYIERTVMASDFPFVDVVVPVPLSVQRWKERGFNQAEIIAAAVARILGVQVDSLSLQRTSHTPMHRGGMDQKAREMSVRNVFAVPRPKLIVGKRILLVDDVLTSGSTVSYCAKVLKKHGASKVDVLTLARAVKAP